MRTAARSLLVLLSIFLVTALAEPAHAAVAHFWSRQANVAGFSATNANAAALDAAGNIYVTGSFVGSTNLGGTTLISAGSGDFFLVKYSPTGSHLWSVRYGSTGNERGNAVACDAAGNVYITGSYTSAASWGGATVIGGSGGDIILAKYNSSGTHQWSKGFGNTGAEEGASLAVTPSGVIFTSGRFTLSFTLGGATLPAVANGDIYLARFDTNGNHVWSQRFGSLNQDYFSSVATNQFSDVYLCCDLQGSASFGGGTLNSAGVNDVVLAKFNGSAGAHQWSQRFGSVGSDRGHAIDMDAAGNVLITGEFENTVNFGGSNLVSAGNLDVFIAKYTPAGAHMWSQRFGGTGEDVGQDIAVDGSNRVIVTGYFYNTVSFGGPSFLSAGDADAFLARYDANGVHQSSQTFGSTDYDAGMTCAADAGGNSVMGTYFTGSVDFGGGNLVSPGASNNMAVARYGAFPREPRIASIVDVPNDNGRNVKISFARTGHDDATAVTPITSYEVFRRDTAPPSFALRTMAMSSHELMLAGWQFVGSLPAHHEDLNIVAAPTVGDSTIVLGQYFSAFFMRAATADPYTFYDSPIDSGYSVDNAAPGVPQNLTITAGVLFWIASTTADFDYFTVYGSSSSVFDGVSTMGKSMHTASGNAVLIGHTTGLNMDVSATPYHYYFLTATDFAGNEGTPARIVTSTGVGGGPPLPRVLAVNAYPNPFNPRTTIHYDVPKSGRVNMRVYDATGAFVTELVKDASRSAGAYSVQWDGLDANGSPVSSGVYFVEVRFGTESKTRKLTLVK